MATELALGTLVENPKCPQWGPGKVLAIEDRTVTVHFRDVLEEKPGDARKNMNLNYVDLKILAEQSDPSLDGIAVGALKKGAARKVPTVRRRLSFEESMEIFQRRFPDMFEDPRYFQQERDYKVAAHERYKSQLGDGRGEALLAAHKWSEMADAAIDVATRKVNLLFSKVEPAALREALAQAGPAGEFFGSLFAVLKLPEPEEATFTRYIAAVAALPASGKVKVATWPVLTVLPFLARPDIYLFCKPKLTQQVAEQLGFTLNYRPKLNWLTYSRVLELSKLLMEKLKPHGARDNIDVYSFMVAISEVKE